MKTSSGNLPAQSEEVKRAILTGRVTELPGNVEALVERMLADLTPAERYRARTIAEAARRSGIPNTMLYRAVEDGELAHERAPVAPRANGKRGASRIFLTLQGVAEWRARRLIAAQVAVEKKWGPR